MVNSFFLAPAFHIPVAGLRNVVVLVGSFKPVGDCWQLWVSGMQSLPCPGSPFTRALPVGASPPLWVLGMQVCPSPRSYSPHPSGQPAQDHSAHFLPTEHTQEVQPVVGKPVPEPKNRWTGIVGQGRAGGQVVVVAGALLCACLVVALLRADLPNVSLGPTAPS